MSIYIETNTTLSVYIHLFTFLQLGVMKDHVTW